MLENLKSIGEPVSAGRLRDADVDADAEVARQVDSAELRLNSTNELRRWSVRKRGPARGGGARERCGEGDAFRRINREDPLRAPV